MIRRAYISGKISGMEAEASKLFEDAELKLKFICLEVINPMKLPHQHDKSWQAFMREDVAALCSCDAIFMLNNWKRSKGARIEWLIAKLLGIKVYYSKDIDGAVLKHEAKTKAHTLTVIHGREAWR